MRDIVIVLEINKYDEIEVERDRDKSNMNISTKEVAYKENNYY